MNVLDTMKVMKHGTHGYWDVFYGDGWYNQFRVRYIKKTDTLVYKKRVGHRLFSAQAKEKIKALIKQYKPSKVKGV